MQVFSQRMAIRGGCPLPLAHYLQPTSASGKDETFLIDPFKVLLDGKKFQDALGSDSGFPMVTAFLLGGVDVNVRDKSGATPLHIAVARCAATAGDDHERDDLLSADCPNQMIISFLLDNGADMNRRNAAGETPLMIAAATQNLGALRILMERGADTMQKDDMGRTLLHHAACYPHVLQMLQLWISDLPARAKQECLLHTVCRQGGHGMEFVALFLIEQLCMNVNAREGETAVVASVDGVTPIANSQEPISSVAVHDGYTPLHCAVVAGDVALVRTLLLKGADVEKADSVGVTPIQLAAGYASSASFLVNLGRFLQRKTQHCSQGGASRRCGNHYEVYKLLIAYRNEASSGKRESVLLRSAAASVSLWTLNTCHDFMLFLGAAFLPHTLVAMVAAATEYFCISVFVALVCMLWCAVLHKRDSQKSNVHPLRSVGLFLGYAVVLSVCCILQAKSTGMLDYYTFTYGWLIFFAVMSVVCLLLVMRRCPETVESTAAQRDGIYRAIFYSKGVVPEDVRQSIDMHSMVRKPVRAQRCRHLGRVVLRFDHYCTWLASSIGAGNHHAYVYFLIFFTGLLGGYWHSTSSSSSSTKTNIYSFPFPPSWERFIGVYVLIVLPITLTLFLITLLQQLWYIGRALTCYDVTYPSRCPWCFNLGSRTYSLFDEGFCENMRRFFLASGDMNVRTYRVPAMNARLQEMAKKYHANQHSQCNSGRFQSGAHEGHGHSHEGHGHSHEGHVAVGDSNTNGISATADGTPTDAKAATTRLFQLMVQRDSADVAADDSMQASFSPAEWQDVVENARSMFNYFKNAMTAVG